MALKVHKNVTRFYKLLHMTKIWVSPRWNRGCQSL